MAIIGFWSGSKKETGQTLAITAIATYMAVNRNYKILLLDATFDDDTMERCFWSMNTKSVASKLAKGKIDISSGAEGLVSAIASNKATPEIITNYTRIVFKNRLDVLCGLKTKQKEDYRKSTMLYKDLLKTADKYYDLVFVDLSKTANDEITRNLLETCSIIVYTMTKNLKQADEYISHMQKYPELLKKEKVLPLLSNADDSVVYNQRNVTRYISAKKEIPKVPYNPTFVKSASEAGVAQFFLTSRTSNKTIDKNSVFISSMEDACKKIIDKLKELQYTV